MSLFARVAAVLALVLPLTAYVAGSLLAAEPAPAQHAPIDLVDAETTTPSGVVDPDPGSPTTEPTPSPEPTTTVTPTPKPTSTPTPKPAPNPKPQRTDPPEVVRPNPIDPDDDDYDDLDDDDDDDETDD